MQMLHVGKELLITYHISISDHEIYGTIEDVKKELEINGYLNEVAYKVVKDMEEIEDEDEFVSWLEEELNIDACIVPMRKDSNIKADTFFITKRECLNHLENNSHHYSNKAHSYAMTAWRSPQVEKLWEVLETIDIDKLINILEEDK